VPEQFLRTWENVGPLPLRDALFRPSLMEHPLPLTKWSRILTIVYEHAEDLLQELEQHVPVMTEEFKMMRTEVTCGQWSEFLTAVERKPDLISNVPFVEDLWRPTDESFIEYAQGYWEHWWLAVERRYKARNEDLPKDEERIPIPPRPPWLSPTTTKLADRHGVLLLIPPDWVRVDEAGNVSWSLEEGTEDLPVTGVSWWDAKAFIRWFARAQGISNLSLPNRGEWMRAFHGGSAHKPPDDFDRDGQTGYQWPWGNEPDHDGCNNISWWSGGDDDKPPRPHNVRRTYGIHEGRTKEGLLNMAGNAAEWTDNYEPRYPPSSSPEKIEGQLYAMTWDKDEEGKPLALAAACGGSYLSGLDECMVDSFVVLDKRARRIDVGFRLILHSTQFGK
jgi:formylglycine-generating enzyme required for sulfatase activity